MLGRRAFTLQAFAPTLGRVANFLALEAQVRKVCPKCEDKDFSDPCAHPPAFCFLATLACEHGARATRCPLGWEEQIDGRFSDSHTRTRLHICWQLFVREVRRTIHLHRILRQDSDLPGLVRCGHTSIDQSYCCGDVSIMFVASCFEDGIGNVVRDLLALELPRCHICLGC